jgi:hypothetical protein
VLEQASADVVFAIRPRRNGLNLQNLLVTDQVVSWWGTREFRGDRWRRTVPAGGHQIAGKDCVPATKHHVALDSPTAAGLDFDPSVGDPSRGPQRFGFQLRVPSNHRTVMASKSELAT